MNIKIAVLSQHGPAHSSCLDNCTFKIRVHLSGSTHKGIMRMEKGFQIPMPVADHRGSR